MNTVSKVLEKTLDTCLKNKRFQDYVNNRFDLNEFVYIGGYYYALNHSILMVEEAQKEYSYEGIKNAIILDIGGNIGGFAIPVSTYAKHVYVVEPLFNTQLKRNVRYNKINNITVFEDIGLGNGNQRIKFNEKRKNVVCVPLSKIIEMCGGHIDFLKIDCEGAEWGITKNDLCSIKRIEMELHCFNKETLEDFLPTLSDFDCEIEQRSNNTYLLHCIKKFFW